MSVGYRRLGLNSALLTAFGAGFLCGYGRGWEFGKAVRLGNADGAMVGARHGCSIAMPFWQEVMAFVDKRGGF